MSDHDAEQRLKRAAALQLVNWDKPKHAPVSVLTMLEEMEQQLKKAFGIDPDKLA